MHGCAWPCNFQASGCTASSGGRHILSSQSHDVFSLAHRLRESRTFTLPAAWAGLQLPSAEPSAGQKAVRKAHRSNSDGLRPLGKASEAKERAPREPCNVLGSQPPRRGLNIAGHACSAHSSVKCLKCLDLRFPALPQDTVQARSEAVT